MGYSITRRIIVIYKTRSIDICNIMTQIIMIFLVINIIPIIINKTKNKTYIIINNPISLGI